MGRAREARGRLLRASLASRLRLVLLFPCRPVKLDILL